MMICHCNGISERRIRKVVRNGADSLHSVARACGAGASCGGCAAEILDIIESERAPLSTGQLHSLADAPEPARSSAR